MRPAPIARGRRPRPATVRRRLVLHPARCACADCRRPAASPWARPHLMLPAGFFLTLALCLLVGPFFGGLDLAGFIAVIRSFLP